MKYHPKSTFQKAFSMAEMLIVVAVIGIIGAVAIPSIGGINSASKTAKNQRNAQSIVAVYGAGFAAGVPWATGTKTTIVQDVINGRSASTGDYSGKIFSVPNVSGNDLTGVMVYIGTTSNGILFYDKSGSQPTS